MLSALSDFLGDLFARGTVPTPVPAPTRARAKPRAPRREVELVEQIALELGVARPDVEPHFEVIPNSDAAPTADAIPSAAKKPLDAPDKTRDATTLLADLRTLDLVGITALRLTRNRTVMVSWKGTQLRVHQGFAQAPLPILRAIVQFVTARRAADRTAAVRVLRAWPLLEQAPRAPRRLATSPDDRPIAERLTALHRTLNADRFGGRLALIEVVVSRRMKTRLGHYALSQRGAPGQIAISRRHLRRHGWQQAAETLLHEMVHQWQDEMGMPVDHGPAFRRKAKELGITPAARRAV